MLRLVQTRSDRLFGDWTAVVIARPGPRGAHQTLATLESLVEHWGPVVDGWDVLLLAPEDDDLRELAADLSGDVEVVWGSTDIDAVTVQLRRRGRRPFLYTAGDVVEPPEWRPPVRVHVVVPTVQTLSAPHASSPLRWAHVEPDGLHRDLVVFCDDAVESVHDHRAAFRIAWLRDGKRAPSPRPEQVLRPFDLVVSDDRDLVHTSPRAAFLPWAGSSAPSELGGIHPKSASCSVVVPGAADDATRATARSIASSLRSTCDGIEVDLHEPREDDAESVLASVTPYRFSVVLEGLQGSGNFGALVVDALRTGTVVIRVGPGTVEEFDPGSLLASEPETVGEVVRGALARPPGHFDAAREFNSQVAASWFHPEDRLMRLLQPYLARWGR